MRTLALCLLFPALYAHAASESEIRAAATRAMAVIQRGTAGFYRSQDCFSCHGLALPALALRAARERGIPVDEAVARANAVKGLSHSPNLASLDASVQDNTIVDPALSEGWALIAADALGMRPTPATGVRARMLANYQRSDGHWVTFDMRPPESDSEFTATAVALRAMLLHMPEPLRKEARERAARAREWLLAAQPRTTEDHTFRLLGLAWAGAGMAERAAAARALLALQRPDGGWGQLPHMQPDAYATGEVLAALHQAGSVATSDAAWQKGLHYLLSTQAADGSWQVRTRMVSPAKVSPPYVETGFPYGKDQQISTMGTCWAAMALMLGLPKAEHPAAAPPLPEFAPKGVAPWMETALFGTAAELQALLDKGLDPNSKTAGGTTLLMMAAPDAAKVKLLIGRSADVRAKAKTGYTALMIASMYRGTSDSVKLLLERGAEAAPGTGVMFNASPLFLAGMAGDAENIALLRSKGADPNRKMVILGIFPTSPLFAALSPGEVAPVKALIAAGANVKEIDQDGMNALHWSALSNHVEVARALIEVGVPLNRKDSLGYTPLLYAATVDFGRADMVTALLQAGADPGISSKEGKTALAQARHYGYPYIAAALEKSGARE